MSAKRFKQPDQGQPQRAASASGQRPVSGHHMGAHAATPRSADRVPPVSGHSASARTQAASVPAAAHRQGSASARARGSRFADATRATASSHQFAHLGGTTDLGVAAGQVPVTASDDGAGSYSGDDAPRPIDVDPAATGSFNTIRRGQGAVISTRETAGRAAAAARRSLPKEARRGQGTRQRSAKAPLPVLVGIGVAALVVVVLLVMLVTSLLGGSSKQASGAATTAPAETVVSAQEGIQLGSYTYSTSQGDQGWELVRSSSSGETAVVAALSGTPASVCLYQGTLYIPENLPDGTWDIICYLPADGSTASQLLGDDGQPVVGSGTVTSAVVQGGSLALSGDGVSQSVPLS